MNSEIKPIPEPNIPKSKRSFWDFLASPSSALKDIGDQRSARLAATFLFAIFILNLIGRIVVLIRDGYEIAFAPEIIFALITSLLAYGFSRTKWFRVSIFIFSLSFSSTAYITIFIQRSQADIATLILSYVPLSLIVAGSFLSSWALLLLTALNIVLFLSLQFIGITLPENLIAQTAIIGVIGVVLILLANYRDNTEKIRLEELLTINQELESLSGNLEQRVNERTNDLALSNKQISRRAEQLTAIANIARSLTNMQDINDLLSTTTKSISQQLGYYHVGIFLNDTQDNNTVLRAANSVGGQKMLNRGHQLQIGKEGIVGYAVKTGQPRIALDVGVDSVYFDNPDLPETRSEIAIPLRLGSEYIGALDIQSTEVNAFSDEDLVVFTTLADQVAIAIQNARLLEQTQIALRDTEDAYAQQTSVAWKSYAQEQTITGYHYDGVESKPITTDIKTKVKFEANKILPLSLRGKIIGHLKLKSADKNREWTDDEIGLIQSTIERATIALENARLLEDAQRRATKERVISEGATRISAALDVESIMQATAEELEQALGGSDIIIQLESNK
ncbi:MAG: GAF domain-containing protein [Anaerolineales bacterium]|uniref:GAF domain-containing protein n=1 Tax=Candidatus Desulfolinea nitratireducens TaxID=2841698 RepID=A0A8J6TJI1_9CHLR|nr:GAF domain-containing protein [Candidatus Desulfolinea nitratireducens]MBL6959761.1 GAF domain-containing protein [Anaerolineales bacterium]